MGEIVEEILQFDIDCKANFLKKEEDFVHLSTKIKFKIVFCFRSTNHHHLQRHQIRLCPLLIVFY